MKKRKSTMPVIIPNQPEYSVYWWKYGDGQKLKAERFKNESNKMKLILSAEKPKDKFKATKQPANVPFIRANTVHRIYNSVRSINN